VRIAVFDYLVEPTNPLGGCHRTILRELCHEHEFTVFAVRFDNPNPERIRFVRIPVPARPLALLFICYHLLAPIIYLLHRLRTGLRYDLVQMVESNLSFGDLSYSQFCHRAYMRKHWKNSGATGTRGLARWIDHKLHAIIEPYVFRSRRAIVVPSRGLARELTAEYPFTRDKIHIISNPVDTRRLQQPPADYDRAAFRAALGIQPDDLAFIFIALGHFERKGLPQLMQAVVDAKNPKVKLLIVGGEQDLIARYRQRAADMGIGNQMVFVGMQKDVGPYLWASDALAFPSFYETFSLVTFQAAAARLPLIVSQLHGVEELLVDGHNGYLVHPVTPANIRSAIERLIADGPQRRAELGENARRASQAFDVETFANRWRSFYARAARWPAVDLSAPVAENAPAVR
jgi:glycosyltransferase involved in cell wall biosynthesis